MHVTLKHFSIVKMVIWGYGGSRLGFAMVGLGLPSIPELTDWLCPAWAGVPMIFHGLV